MDALELGILDSYEMQVGGWRFVVGQDFRSWKEGIEETRVYASGNGTKTLLIRCFFYGDGDNSHHIRNFCQKFATHDAYRRDAIADPHRWTPWMDMHMQTCIMLQGEHGLGWGDRFDMEKRLYHFLKKNWRA